MRSALPTIILTIVALAAFAAWVGYKYTPWYRDGFIAKFQQIQPGDTHERMISLLGKPDHFCPVYALEPSSDSGVMVRNSIGVIEIYTVGEDAFGIEYPYVEADDIPIGSKLGPAKEKMQEHLDICIGGDSKY